MSVRRSHTVYAAVRTEGGLLPPDFIDRIQLLDESLGGLTASDYRLPEKSRLDTEIAQAWQAVQTHFASFRLTRDRIAGDSAAGTTETRTWVQQVLRELGYPELRYVAQAETIGDRSYLVSHRAGDAGNSAPIHIISFKQELDTRAARTGGREQRSPQALMQGYLNASSHQWGVVTNGLVFRLLRENRQIDRALRVEFDLEGMLESENFAEFRLFWLILHRSRFVQPEERYETAWLERWSQTASREGARAMEALRPGVEKAIQELGEGLLAHPDNHHLNQKLYSGELTVDAYYSQLLRLVYRLLFLLVAEERQLLFTADADERAVNRYRKHYSIERLREEASRRRNREKHQDDLWRGLLVTFDAMRFQKEAATLGVQPLSGGLFGPGSCPDVADDAAPGTTGADRIAGRPLLSNAHLLNAIQALSEVTRDSITRRINYRDLDVEELGSVYEGLLERRPALEPQPSGRNRFEFADSTSRKETGSYYTPSSLVQELLNSALDPVIEQAVANMRTPEDKRKSLLALNVIDPACGSGHFLLGAARRIGRRLAEIEAGEGNEPELADIRHGVREAIRHCIYGVDKNPLAIDLCKTALWIESHEPGAPISFLDHHIKRGDSLVGVFDLNVLESGIPDGAFTAVTGDDSKIATELKKRNTKEKPKQTALADGSKTTSRTAGLWEADDLRSLVESLAIRLDEIDAMSGSTIDEVTKKKDAYDKIRGGGDWNKVNIACDLWTYAFFAPLTSANNRYVPTSATVRRMISKGDVPGDIVGQARAVADDVGFFHWPLQFPEVFQLGGFDAVIGNPPYLDSEALTKQAPKMRNFATCTFQSASGNWDLFVPFVELASKLAIRGGYHVMVTPNKLLASDYSAELQRILLEFTPTICHDYSAIDVFDSAAVPVVTLTVRKLLGESSSKVCFVRHLRDMGAVRSTTSLMVLRQLPNGYIGAPLYLENADDLVLLATRAPMSSVASFSDGATTGEAYEIREKVVESDAYAVDEPSLFRIVNTGTIDPYLSLWGIKEIRYLKFKGKHPVIDRTSLGAISKRRLSQAERDKVLIGGMGSRIEAVTTTGNVLCGKSAVLVLPNDGVCGFALSVLFNSRLLNDLYRGLFGLRGLGSGSMNIGPRQLEMLPVPPIGTLAPFPAMPEGTAETMFSFEDLDSLISLDESELRSEAIDGRLLSKMGRSLHHLHLQSALDNKESNNANELLKKMEDAAERVVRAVLH